MEPIRILQVVTYMGRGGLETMLMNYYRHIDRSQIQFDFLTHRDFRADYDDEIEAMGGRIYRLPRLVPWSRNYRKALSSFFAEHPEYRIVHVHQDCLSSVILKAAKKHGVPVRIAHSHNSNQDKNLRYLIKLYYRRQIPKYSTDLFACGKDAGDWMFRGQPYSILNNAIDAGSYVFDSARRKQVRNSLGIADDAFVVGHVGRFYPQKNHSFLLDIFSSLKTKRENAVLLLVGDGELRQEAEQKAKDLGVANRVIFTGVRNDVADLMQAMDCFVFPSLYEGLPVTLVEAQASGLPCVVSDTVPVECRLTDLLIHVPLEMEAAHWANEAIRQAALGRKTTLEQIRRAGYDIQAGTDYLQRYYLEKQSRQKG